MAARYDLDFMLGEHWVLQIACTEGPAGDPIDLTGGSAEFLVATETSVVLDLNSPSNITMTDPTNGVITVVITPEQQTTANVVAGVYAFQLRVTLAGGTVSDQAYGNLTARPNIFDKFNA